MTRQRSLVEIYNYIRSTPWAQTHHWTVYDWNNKKSRVKPWSQTYDTSFCTGFCVI